MFGKINPKQIEGMMKKMGIAQTSLDAKRVIIELEDENIIIDEPSVTKINMQGQETFQISGESRVETREGYSEEDVAMVVEKTGASKEEVIEFLKENNDIAAAIIELKK
jgi:nascent polypeptide-associated complex subunit alpha